MTETISDGNHKSLAREQLLDMLSERMKGRAAKTREDFKERTLSQIGSLHSYLFNEEFADLCGHQFKFTPNSLHHITACLNALEQAINKGELIRRKLPNACDGKVVFLNSCPLVHSDELQTPSSPECGI